MPENQTPVDVASSIFVPLYHQCMSGLVGRFTAGELSLMLDVANSLALTPVMMGQHLTAECLDGIGLEGLDDKWGVQEVAFRDRLHSLSPFEATCLEIWSRAFWESGAYENDDAIHTYIKPLLK